MTTLFNTGNAVPSNSPKDLDDNAKILDLLLSSTDQTTPNRLGISTTTWQGALYNFYQSGSFLGFPDATTMNAFTPTQKYVLALNTATNLFYYWSGSAWVATSLSPPSADNLAQYKGATQPLASVGTRNNQTPLTPNAMSSAQRNLLLNMISGATVYEADPDLYYSIGYIGTGSAPSVQIYAHPKSTYATSDTKYAVYNATVDLSTALKYAGTTYTFVLTLNTASTTNKYATKLSITIDVDKYSAYNTNFLARETSHSAYGWIIDPRHYMVIGNYGSAITANTNNILTLQSQVNGLLITLNGLVDAVRQVANGNSVTDPFIKLGSINGYVPKDPADMSAVQNLWLLNCIVGATVNNAHPDYYYSIGYFGTGSTPTVQLYAHKKSTFLADGNLTKVYDATFDASSLLSSTAETLTFNFNLNDIVSGSVYNTVMTITLNVSTFIVLTNYNTAGSPFLAWNKTQSAYGWIVDPRRYNISDGSVTASAAATAAVAAMQTDIATLKSNVDNKSKAFPLTTLGSYAGVTPKALTAMSAEQRNWIQNIFVDASVSGADPNYIYYIGYMGTGATPSVQIYQVARTKYTSTTAAVKVADVAVSIPTTAANYPRHTFSVTLDNTLISNTYTYQTTVSVTIDVANYLANASAFVAWAASHSAYGWMIDPSVYDFDHNWATEIGALTTTIGAAVAGKGVPWPFASQGVINGVSPNAITDISAPQRNIILNIIIDAKVFNADPDYYYSIGYFGTGLKPTLQVYALPKSSYRANGTAYKVVDKVIDLSAINIMPGRTYTFVVDFNVVSGGSTIASRMSITIDNDAHLANATAFVAWNNTHSAYGWIVNSECYVYNKDYDSVVSQIQDSINYNSFVPTQAHNGIAPVGKADLGDITQAVYSKIFKKVEVLGAAPNTYYWLSYLSLVGTASTYLTLAVRSLDIASYPTSGSYTTVHSDILYDVAADIKAGLTGVKEYIVNAKHSTNFKGTGIWFKFLIDLDALRAASTGTTVWSVADTTSTGYAWIISPHCYNIDTSRNQYNRMKRSTTGVSTVTETTASTRLGADPVVMHAAFMSSGLAQYDDTTAIADASMGTLDFRVFNMLETNWDVPVSEISNETTFDYPLIAVEATTGEMPIDLGLFLPYITNMAGITYFRYNGTLPLRAVVKGHLDVLVRVPDATTSIQLQASLRTNYNSNTNDSDTYQRIGMGTSWGQTPAALIPAEADQIIDTYSNLLRADLYKRRSTGLWVKVSVPIHSDVIFYPGCIYSFRFVRQVMQGTEYPTDVTQVDPWEVMVYAGGMSAQFNARDILTQNYHHSIRGFK